MYESPIELTISEVLTQVNKSKDEAVYQAVQKIGVNIDKDELIKALTNDRRQYDKGFHDAAHEINEKFKERIIADKTISTAAYRYLFDLVDEITQELKVNPAPIMPAEAWNFLINKDLKVEALEKELEKRGKFIEALKNIVSYNCHEDFLYGLVPMIRDAVQKGENLACPIPTSEWGTEEHFFWMILVGMFGDCGTSCRSGWINCIDAKNAENCVSFIGEICQE